MFGFNLEEFNIFFIVFQLILHLDIRIQRSVVLWTSIYHTRKIKKYKQLVLRLGCLWRNAPVEKKMRYVKYAQDSYDFAVFQDNFICDSRWFCLWFKVFFCALFSQNTSFFQIIYSSVNSTLELFLEVLITHPLNALELGLFRPTYK